MKTVYLFIGLIVSSISFGQNMQTRLSGAIKALEADTQFKHAILSLYVVDSKTGNVVFDKNSQVGLAPASSQKVVTSVSAFEMLGKGYRYKTDLSYSGLVENDTLKGHLFITAYGDPSLGSFRWDGTSDALVMKNILAGLNAKKIRTITGSLFIDETGWETQATPRGWTWEDVGNYYGAGARGLNWHENQYDLLLKPGKKEGDNVEIINTSPELQGAVLRNELKTGKKGSGDNSIIYLPEDGLIGYVRGTVPAGNETFKVSGAMPDASLSFIKSFGDMLEAKGIKMEGRDRSGTLASSTRKDVPVTKTLLSILSPSFDSINYWFLKKSVNLYGEAFVKTISYEKTRFGATDTGISIIKNFWQERGIERSALNIIDGSGLSPANRVTTHGLVTVMQYARRQNWFSSFYYALPEMNGIKMKDGYISGVRSYTGYIKNRSGTEYTFSFIVNNFDGSPGTVREKMWKLLDILKTP